MDLADYRNEMDRIDRELVKLLEERLAVSHSIGAYKREHQLPVYDAAREEAVIQRCRRLVKSENADDIEQIYRLLFEISKRRQHE